MNDKDNSNPCSPEHSLYTKRIASQRELRSKYQQQILNGHYNDLSNHKYGSNYCLEGANNITDNNNINKNSNNGNSKINKNSNNSNNNINKNSNNSNNNTNDTNISSYESIANNDNASFNKNNAANNNASVHIKQGDHSSARSIGKARGLYVIKGGKDINSANSTARAANSASYPMRDTSAAARPTRDAKDTRNMRDTNNTRDMFNTRDAQDAKDAHDTRDTRDTHDTHESLGITKQSINKNYNDAQSYQQKNSYMGLIKESLWEMEPKNLNWNVISNDSLSAMNQVYKRASQINIAVVDENPSILLKVKHALSPYGYEIRTYSNPSVALMKLKETPCNLLIATGRLKYMNGVKMADFAKNTGLASHILLLLEKGDGYMLKMIRDEQINGYLLKPLSNNELIDKVSALFDVD